MLLIKLTMTIAAEDIDIDDKFILSMLLIKLMTPIAAEELDIDGKSILSMPRPR